MDQHHGHSSVDRPAHARPTAQHQPGRGERHHGDQQVAPAKRGPHAQRLARDPRPHAPQQAASRLSGPPHRGQRTLGQVKHAQNGGGQRAGQEGLPAGPLGLDVHQGCADEQRGHHPGHRAAQCDPRHGEDRCAHEPQPVDRRRAAPRPGRERRQTQGQPQQYAAQRSGHQTDRIAGDPSGRQERHPGDHHTPRDDRAIGRTLGTGAIPRARLDAGWSLPGRQW